MEPASDETISISMAIFIPDNLVAVTIRQDKALNLLIQNDKWWKVDRVGSPDLGGTNNCKVPWIVRIHPGGRCVQM